MPALKKYDAFFLKKDFVILFFFKKKTFQYCFFIKKRLCNIVFCIFASEND